MQNYVEINDVLKVVIARHHTAFVDDEQFMELLSALKRIRPAEVVPKSEAKVVTSDTQKKPNQQRIKMVEEVIQKCKIDADFVERTKEKMRDMELGVLEEGHEKNFKSDHRFLYNFETGEFFFVKWSSYKRICRNRNKFKPTFYQPFERVGKEILTLYEQEHPDDAYDKAEYAAAYVDRYFAKMVSDMEEQVQAYKEGNGRLSLI